MIIECNKLGGGGVRGTMENERMGGTLKLKWRKKLGKKAGLHQWLSLGLYPTICDYRFE